MRRTPFRPWRVLPLWAWPLLAFAVFAVSADAGELRPLDLPSQRSAYPAQRAQPAVDETIYREFETAAREWSIDERRAAKQRYANRAEAARQAQRYAEAAHYGRLVVTLSRLN